jgi:hypothetical protein
MQASRVELRGRSRLQVWEKWWLSSFTFMNMALAVEVLHGYINRELLSSRTLILAGLALLVNCGFLFGFVLLPSKITLQSRRSAAIKRLYREIRSLMESSPEPESDWRIQARFAELRSLQEAEADEMERRLESRLHLKTGEGWKALQRAEDLLARYENSASQNPSARHSH